MSLLTKWSFKNKSAVGLLVFMSLIIGVLSYFRLPMEFLPAADNPQVTITAIGPGFDAKSMESGVTAPLENVLSNVKDKTSMFSTSGDGYTKIDINFDSNANMKEAKAEVQEAVNTVQLPQGVMKPYVLQLNTSMIPISQLSVAFQEGLSEKELETQQKAVIAELQSIDGVSNVQLMGKAAPAVSVKVDLEKLARSGVPMQSLMGVLQGRNVSASIGEKNMDGTTGNVKVISSIDSLDVLKKLPVAKGVVLSDIASVEIKKTQESVSRLNGKEVLFAAVNKETNANAVSVAKGVQKAVDRLNKENGKVELNVFYSSADMVVTSVNSMMREVLMGALFATIVILLFLRNFRATLITIVSIPLSLGITLYLLSVSGVTLNIITLGGVAVAVGRLVDDSIVVIENIYRRLQKEKFSVEMIISATKEVATAITSSTITTVAVFLPMGLLRGGLQAFLLPFALTVTYSLLASLITALTVVPLLSSLLLKNTRMKEHEGPKAFTRFLHWNLRHKYVTLILAAVLFFGSIGTYAAMPKGAIDSSDTTFLSIALNYPSDTPVEKVVEEGKRLEKYLMDRTDSTKFVLMQNGNSADAAKWGDVVSPTLVNLSVVLKPKVDAEVFMEEVRKQKDQFPGATLTAGAMNFMGGGSTSTTVDILGDDAAANATVATELLEKIKAVDGVEKVTTNQQETKPVYNVKVDPSTTNAQELAMQLQGMMNAIPMGTMTLNQKESPVVLEPMVNPAKMADLGSIMVGTASGAAPLGQLAKIEKAQEPASLFHKDGKTYIRITAVAEPEKLSVVGSEIKKLAGDVTPPEGVKIMVGGASAEQEGDMSSLYMILLISIFLVYLIMVLTFKTLRAPFAIIMSLPLATIGAVVGLIVSGVTPDYTAVFGALMLVGIVVTNAIVLIDRVKHNEQHMPIREAILEAATTRMRPILMTAVATICAMLPLLFGKTEMGSIVSQSLAIVVIGGLAAATLLTLVVVPVIYELLYFRKSAKQRKAQRQNTAAA
ncbi:efflux RND transporter permease subunit [Gorillibacterium sp. sgz5001074]|uniref:efflux RND transporter permease subunit n=1 Tax=Gorillibacterium sp. sgz5001074 TaxID=3446695 RepID=UPI003F67A136